MRMNMQQLTQRSHAPSDKVMLFQQKLLNYLKSNQISTDDLKEKTGFDEVDLKAMKPELQRPVLAALAAVEEVFRINQRLRKTLAKQVAERIKAEKIKKEKLENDEPKLVFQDGKSNKNHTMAWADKDSGIHYESDQLNSLNGKSQKSGWLVSAGEGMPREVQVVLPVILTILHECGHQYESCLQDECLKVLSEKVKQNILGIPNLEKEIQKINSRYVDDVSLALNCMERTKDTSFVYSTLINCAKQSKDIRVSILGVDWSRKTSYFGPFVCRKFMQYAMEKTEKEYGKKPIAGLVFKPGGKAKSLSLYASTNTKDFYAELFAKVLMTNPNFLTPLGKTMRKLLNSDGAEFKKWFCNEIVKDNGKEYKEHEAYCQAGRHGYGDCPAPSDTLESDVSLRSAESLCRELQSFGFVGDASGLDSPGLRFAIQFNLASNYNMARTQTQAKELQTKLANAVTILEKMCKRGGNKDADTQRMYKKFQQWKQAKESLLLMSEYCSFANPDKTDADALLTARSYACLDTLRTLAERDPKDFKTLDACEKFLDKEIAAVGREIQAAKAQRKQKLNKRPITRPITYPTSLAAQNKPTVSRVTNFKEDFWQEITKLKSGISSGTESNQCWLLLRSYFLCSRANPTLLSHFLDENGNLTYEKTLKTFFHLSGSLATNICKIVNSYHRAGHQPKSILVNLLLRFRSAIRQIPEGWEKNQKMEQLENVYRTERARKQQPFSNVRQHVQPAAYGNLGYRPNHYANYRQRQYVVNAPIQAKPPAFNGMQAKKNRPIYGVYGAQQKGCSRLSKQNLLRIPV